MRVAIVDDSREMLEIICSKIEGVRSVECECDGFRNPEELLIHIEKGQEYDLYLLDIEMPAIGGLELAKEIRRRQENAYLVFLTAYERYALESYDMEIQAYQYLLKEDMEEKLPLLLEKIADELDETKGEYYFIESRQHYEKIRIAEICCLCKDGKNTVIVTKVGEYRERKPLKETLQELGKPEFLSIDAGNALNVKYIRSMEKDKIVLDNGREFYVSHITMKKLRREVMEYWKHSM